MVPTVSILVICESFLVKKTIHEFKTVFSVKYFRIFTHYSCFLLFIVTHLSLDLGGKICLKTFVVQNIFAALNDLFEWDPFSSVWPSMPFFQPGRALSCDFWACQRATLIDIFWDLLWTNGKRRGRARLNEHGGKFDRGIAEKERGDKNEHE